MLKLFFISKIELQEQTTRECDSPAVDIDSRSINRWRDLLNECNTSTVSSVSTGVELTVDGMPIHRTGKSKKAAIPE